MEVMESARAALLFAYRDLLRLKPFFKRLG